MGSGIKTIETSAFENCSSLNSVVIPESVEVVGEWAFYDCQGLEELRLGSGVQRIEKGAFCNCRSLKSVDVPDSVEIVGKDAFSDCQGLEELRLGTGIKEIEKDAFDPQVTLVVDAGSYAEQWCRENQRKYKIR